MWEAVETEAGKIGVAKTEEGRKEKRSGKEVRGERGKEKRKEKTQRIEDGDQKGSREIGDLG